MIWGENIDTKFLQRNSESTKHLMSYMVISKLPYTFCRFTYFYLIPIVKGVHKIEKYKFNGIYIIYNARAEFLAIPLLERSFSML